MKKKIALPILFLLSFAIFASAATMTNMGGTSDGVYEVTVHIEQGWNLIAGILPNQGILPGSDVKASNIKAVWYYSPLQRKYIQIHPNPDNDAINRDDEDFVLTSAMWVYSDKQGMLKYSTLEDYHPEKRQLYAGWNLVTMIPNFIESGKYPDVTLKELVGDCNIEKAYYFVGGKWHSFDMPEMDSSLLARGMAIKVSRNCAMEYTGMPITPPPQLPN